MVPKYHLKLQWMATRNPAPVFSTVLDPMIHPQPGRAGVLQWWCRDAKVDQDFYFSRWSIHIYIYIHYIERIPRITSIYRVYIIMCMYICVYIYICININTHIYIYKSNSSPFLDMALVFSGIQRGRVRVRHGPQGWGMARLSNGYIGSQRAA